MSKLEDFSDAALIAKICGQAKDRNKALQYIFAQSGWCENIIAQLRKRGATVAVAENAIQDSLIVLDRQVRCGQFKKGESLENYFWGICKWMYIRATKQRKDLSIEGTKEDLEEKSPETEIFKDNLKEIVRQLLSQLNGRCQSALKLYMLSFSMREIGDELQTNENHARKIVHDCRLKLAELIDENPDLKSELKNR